MRVGESLRNGDLATETLSLRFIRLFASSNHLQGDKGIVDTMTSAVDIAQSTPSNPFQ
jgi:hypothetical protein